MTHAPYFPVALPNTKVGQIHFTAREVDVIACMMNNRIRHKDIARFLGIESRTIETHLKNIFNKVGGGSWETLRDFIEAQPEVEQIHKHFQALLPQQLFLEVLQQLNKAEDDPREMCFVTSNRVMKPAKFLGDKLKRAGWPISFIELTEFVEISPGDNSHLYVVLVTPETPHMAAIKKHVQNCKNVLVIVNTSAGEKAEGFKDEAQLITNIAPLGAFSYDALEKLLQHTIHTPEAKELLRQKMEEVIGLTQGVVTRPLSQVENKENLNERGMNMKGSRGLKIASLLSSIVLGIIGLGYLWQAPNYRRVQCELQLPSSDTLLRRTDQMSQLDDLLAKANSDTEIPTLGIVGISGVGKTTLARLWGRTWQKKHSDAVIWEINADTKTTLNSSLQSLAYALAHTSDQKSEINFIEQIKNPEKRAELRLAYIRTNLSSRKWLLIIDNLEKPSDLEGVLPQNPDLWGNGIVLITTRNENLKNSPLVQRENVIVLEPLSEEKALQLLSKILYNKKPTQLDSNIKEEAKAFLQHVPHFPLDITLAATYMRVHGLAFGDYLRELRYRGTKLQSSQNEMLKEIATYHKTRFSLISFSGKKILETNPEYAKPLLASCLMDSQKIPVKIIAQLLPNPKDISQFIERLEKESLITVSYKNGAPVSFSFHRSTQELCLFYLVERFGISPTNPTQILTETLVEVARHVDTIQKLRDVDTQKILEPHLEAIGGNEILPLKIRAPIKIIRGTIMFSTASVGNSNVNLQFIESAINECPLDSVHNKTVVARGFRVAGRLAQIIGLNDKCETYFKKSIQLSREINNMQELSLALAWYGNQLKTLEIDKATVGKVFLESLELGRKSGLPSPSLSQTCVGVASFYNDIPDTETAERYFLEAIELLGGKEKTLNYAWTIGVYGKLFQTKGDDLKAVELYKESISIHDELNQGKHHALTWIKIRLGMSYLAIGEYDKALVVLHEAVDLNRLYNAKANYGIGLLYLGQAYLEKGNYEKAKSLLEESAVLKFQIDGDVESPIWALEPLARLRLVEKRYAEAQRILEESYNKMRVQHPLTNVGVMCVARTLGITYAKQGHQQKAIDFIQMLIKTCKKEFGQTHIFTGKALAALSEVYKEIGDTNKATELYTQAAKIFKAAKLPRVHYQ